MYVHTYCTAIPLRDVEQRRLVWSCQASSIDWPQASQYPEQRALPAPIGTGNEKVHPVFNLQDRGAW